jgi:U6 snRNA-associated Sm-like protein LSm3
MVISNCEETFIEYEIDENNEKIDKVNKRKIPMLFVRGDIIILISPSLKN